MAANVQPVLILGAGINGSAIARELVLNSVPVCLVDTADIASGTTSFSSRLIHGGLRYLEYAEFDLVRESLHERTRLLRLAPDFVRPLQLFIPVETRFTGLLQSAKRFLGLRLRKNEKPAPRGLWLVRAGLVLYDLFARDRSFPRHAVHRAADAGVPKVDSSIYRWTCSYYDAQIQSPEQFVVAMLRDAFKAAQENGTQFSVHPYHQAALQGENVSVYRCDDLASGQAKRVEGIPVAKFKPAAIINATGAWVDHTLARLNIDSRRLIGGTKGSHLLTPNQSLRKLLSGGGIYTEAADGRPVFLLPLGEMSLIGTTDLQFEGAPELAVASKSEIDYLLQCANRVFPNLSLSEDDVDLHYSGIRPLPHTQDSTPGSISRKHQLVEHSNSAVPLFSVVGGKLTTCRSLAEEVTAKVLRQLDIQVRSDSRQRIIPSLDSQRDESNDVERIADTALPIEFVRQVIRTQWVTHLSDLVERRLMLLYKEKLTAGCLRHLAQLLADESVISQSDVEAEIDSTVRRLRSHFGKRVIGINV